MLYWFLSNRDFLIFYTNERKLVVLANIFLIQPLLIVLEMHCVACNNYLLPDNRPLILPDAPPGYAIYCDNNWQLSLPFLRNIQTRSKRYRRSIRSILIDSIRPSRDTFNWKLRTRWIIKICQLFPSFRWEFSLLRYDHPRYKVHIYIHKMKKLVNTSE